MRELSIVEMNVVAGGFSIGSCSIGGSYTSHSDGHGGTSTSVSFHAGCGVNAPDVNGTASNSRNGSSNNNGNRGNQSSQRGGGKNR